MKKFLKTLIRSAPVEFLRLLASVVVEFRDPHNSMFVKDCELEATSEGGVCLHCTVVYDPLGCWEAGDKMSVGRVTSIQAGHAQPFPMLVTSAFGNFYRATKFKVHVNDRTTS